MEQFYEIVADDISVKFDIVGCCGAEFREKLRRELLS